MMRTFYKVLLISLLMQACSEKVSDMQARFFVKFFGSYQLDAGYDVKFTPDGGSVITGVSELEGRQGEIFLMKVDEYGNEAEWSPVYFGYHANDAGKVVAVLNDGYLVGGSVTDTVSGNKNMYLVKTDLSGAKQWDWEFKSNLGDDEVLCLDIDPQGRIIFGGYRAELGVNYLYSALLSSNGEFIGRTDRNKSGWTLGSLFEDAGDEFVGFGNAAGATAAQNRFFLIRFNSVGNDLVNKELQNENFSEVLNSACRGGDDRFYLTGTAINSAGTTKRVHLKRIDKDTLTWSKTFGDNNLFEGKAVSVRDDGNILVAADKTVGADNRNIVLFVLDPDGNIISTKEYGSSGDQSAEGIDFLNDGILITGRNAFEGNSMITLIKTDRNGNLWE